MVNTNGDTGSLKRRRIASREHGFSSDETPHEPEKSLLEALPLDMIFEILSYLDPVELLQLARTRKSFRNLLASKGSRNIWRQARVSLGIQVPECPPDQSEPQWASLIFDTTCQICGSSDSNEVEWGFRLRGCRGCLEDNLISGSEIPSTFPGVSDIKKALDLLPFTYKLKWHEGSLLGSPLSTKRTCRQYYQPKIQPMVELYRLHKAQVSAKAPGAKNLLDKFVAERKEFVAAVLGTEEELKRWEVDMRKQRERKEQAERLKWHKLYRRKLVALGYNRVVATRAVEETSPDLRLEDGWKANRVLFKTAASEIQLEERSSNFHEACRVLLAQSNKKAPIRGLLPSTEELLNVDARFKVILETGTEELFQADLMKTLPTVLNRWWEMKKELMVHKVIAFTPTRSVEDTPKNRSKNGQPSSRQGRALNQAALPSFPSAYASASGPFRFAILGLAKSVFTCSGLCELSYSPIYWDESLPNHRCIQKRHPDRSDITMDLHELQFDASASKMVDTVCTALGLNADHVKFRELDDLDARFRCIGCPDKQIVNWRVAIKHQHNTSHKLPPTFARIPDEEAEIVREFELENPDMNCPLGRIRSRLFPGKAFYTIDELRDFLEKEGVIDERDTPGLTRGYWVDPCVPPQPVLEAAVFPG